MLLILRAVSHDGRADPVDIVVLRAARLTRLPQPFADDEMLPRGRIDSAELLGPMRDQQTRLRQFGAKQLRKLCRGFRAGTQRGDRFPVGREIVLQEQAIIMRPVRMAARILSSLWNSSDIHE